ncbi:hypothetical protein ACFFLS_09920 [Flavobacterium procerum]|uniref:Lipoprotein n=1 Tax=Flavobacterium procerum TaxID=1455569 RepID=A0ABV6BPL1_9FLAO
MIISCRNKDSATEIATMPGVAANLKGLDLFSTEDLSSGKTAHLNYASKIEIISIDTLADISKIRFKNQELYASAEDIEMLSKEENDKSYFTKDCYCLLGIEEVRTINFPTKFDTVHFYTKNNKIRLIKQIAGFHPSYEVYKMHDVEISREDSKVSVPNLYYYSVINKNNFFTGNSFIENNKPYLECYNKKTTYEVTTNSSKLLKYYVPEGFNYAIHLFNTDLLYAKIDSSNFVKPLENFNYKNERIYIEQSDLYLEKATFVKIYNPESFKPIAYHQDALSFNYLREIKIVQKDGKKRYFAKINVSRDDHWGIAGEYYIDLKEIAVFASVQD